MNLNPDAQCIEQDRQTDNNRRPMFSYSWGRNPLRKYENSLWPDGLDYHTSLAYAREVKMRKSPIILRTVC